MQLTETAPLPQPTAEKEDFPTILRRARSAVDLLAQLKIPPTPARFTVGFMHQTGDMPELSQTLNRLIGQDKLTILAVDEIFDQYFGRLIEEADLRDASKRIERTVAEVVDCIDVASDGAQRYGTVLAGFSGQVEGMAEVMDETQRMAEVNRQLESRLQISAREIEQLRDHLTQLEREASMDSLTGIANRKSLDKSLRDAISFASREEKPMCVLMIDIDHFKLFNDTHGHQLGDQVLKLVARNMTDCIKGLDTAARYGGEEFCVVLPQTRLHDAAHVGDTIRNLVASKKVINRRTGIMLGQITLSVGVAQYRPGESSGDLINRADEALYLAKQTGRNRVMTEHDLQDQKKD